MKIKNSEEEANIIKSINGENILNFAEPNFDKELAKKIKVIFKLTKNLGI